MDRPDEEVQLLLNGVGQHGWELIDIIVMPGAARRRIHKTIFKRPVEEPSPP